MKAWANTRKIFEVSPTTPRGLNTPVAECFRREAKTEGRGLSMGEVCDSGRGRNRVQYALKRNEQGY